MIRILEKNVADKIAAGEVIDRPVSIVKELVENSIDAGADDITVEIRNGGKTYIRVTDNGSGISPEETAIAFKRHATSKITTAEDLDSIDTLGFRGEALASICAVSRVELITKTKNNKIGRKIIIEGSETVDNSGIGCPEGTTVTVKDLFFNTPARLKFLSADNSEARRVIEMVSRIALSYGDIRFTMINGKNRVFTTQGKGNILNNIVNIYGKDIAENLIPVEERLAGYVLKGFVSAPSGSAASRSKQIFCVNGRVVTSKTMEAALENAYKEKLFQGRFPMAFLFLAIPPNKLDVNIHPTKKEIRFDDKFEIMDFITSSVKNALYAKSALPKIKDDNLKSMQTVPSWNNSDDNAIFDMVTLSEITPQQVREENIVKEKYRVEEDDNIDINKLLSSMRKTQNEEVQLTLEKLSKEPFDFDELKCIGTVFNTYITAYDSDSFYMIDQHAAHERIFYEKLLKQYNSSEKLSQQLMLPFSFDVPAHISADEEKWLDELLSMGYNIENFGERTYIVREIPAFMEIAEAETFLYDIFKELDDKPDLTNKNVLDKIIMRSCKNAVKSGDILSKEETEALINELKNCVNPFSCPHGRPTFIRMTRHEIEKMFKRV